MAYARADLYFRSTYVTRKFDFHIYAYISESYEMYC